MQSALKQILVVPVVALALLGRAAWAQQAGAPPPSAINAEAEARRHFDLADGHFGKQEWHEALEEYRLSLSFKKKASTMVDIAACLKAIGSYDEALEQYEELRREFPKLSAKLEAKVAPVIAELEGLVGTLSVAGDAPAGAVLFVDDRKRGTLPLDKALRLSVGSHDLRVEKEGFSPIAGKVVVAPGQENVAELVAVARQGRLQVSEKHGWALDVEVDGALVGKTPWEGLVAPGDHAVRLHGFVRLDAIDEDDPPGPASAEVKEGALDRTEMGSTTSIVAVRLYERTPLPLAAKELDASLRVEASPAAAAVAIDGKVVGYGVWEGRLPLGAHRVEVSAGGFLPAKQELRLERRKQRELRVDLVPEPKAGAWGPKRSAAVGVAYGLGAVGLTVSAVTGAVALSTIGEVRSHCAYPLCPVSQEASVDKAKSLATASTVALVAGGAGMAVGTALVVWYRPDEPSAGPGRPQPSAVRWRAGVGLLRFEIEGRF